MVFAGSPSAQVDAAIMSQAYSVVTIALVILLISLIICIILVKGIARIVVHAGDMLVRLSFDRMADLIGRYTRLRCHGF
mgnify:CR=1 FL=1